MYITWQRDYKGDIVSIYNTVRSEPAFLDSEGMLRPRATEPPVDPDMPDLETSVASFVWTRNRFGNGCGIWCQRTVSEQDLEPHTMKMIEFATIHGYFYVVEGLPDSGEFEEIALPWVETNHAQPLSDADAGALKQCVDSEIYSNYDEREVILHRRDGSTASAKVYAPTSKGFTLGSMDVEKMMNMLDGLDPTKPLKDQPVLRADCNSCGKIHVSGVRCCGCPVLSDSALKNKEWLKVKTLEYDRSSDTQRAK